MKHLLLFLFLLPSVLTQAQDDTYYQKNPARRLPKREYSVLLKDGTSLRGEVVSQDSVEAIVRTRNLGEVRIPVGQIVKIELLTGADSDRPVSRSERSETSARPATETYINQFPQTMRYTPTAFLAEKGKAYFRNYGLYVSQFEYGVTDNWSVSASFFSVLPTAAFSLNTKVSIPVGDRLRIGASAQYAALRTDGLFNSGLYEGITYVQGLATTGDRQNNTTYGVGWTISNGAVSRNFVATFGLVRKVGPKVTFISENLILLGSGASRNVGFAGTISGGVRLDRRRHAFDLAMYVPFIFGTNTRQNLTLAPFVSYHLRLSK